MSTAERDLVTALSFEVRVDKPNGHPSVQDIAPLEGGQALSAPAQSTFWPPLTFYGTPLTVALQ